MDGRVSGTTQDVLAMLKSSKEQQARQKNNSTQNTVKAKLEMTVTPVIPRTNSLISTTTRLLAKLKPEASKPSADTHYTGTAFNSLLVHETLDRLQSERNELVARKATAHAAIVKIEDWLTKLRAQGIEATPAGRDNIKAVQAAHHRIRYSLRRDNVDQRILNLDKAIAEQICILTRETPQQAEIVKYQASHHANKSGLLQQFSPQHIPQIVAEDEVVEFAPVFSDFSPGA